MSACLATIALIACAVLGALWLVLRHLRYCRNLTHEPRELFSRAPRE